MTDRDIHHLQRDEPMASAGAASPARFDGGARRNRYSEATPNRGRVARRLPGLEGQAIRLFFGRRFPIDPLAINLHRMTRSKVQVPSGNGAALNIGR